MTQDIWGQFVLDQQALLEAQEAEMWSQLSSSGHESAEQLHSPEDPEFQICQKCGQPRWKHIWMIPGDLDPKKDRDHEMVENGTDAEFYFSTWCCDYSFTAGEFTPM